MVSAVSWLVQQGQPLYHDLDAADRYSVLYGPSVYLTNGLFLEILGPSLFSAKLASFLGAVFSLVFFYAALARRKVDTTALWVTGFVTLYYWMQGFAVYLVRPDSLTLFSISFGLFAVVKTRRTIGCLALAVVIGFVVNLKIHAGLYCLPILGILIDRWGWRAGLLTLGGAFLVVLAPFALYPQVSLATYLLWLSSALKHGLSTSTLLLTGRYVVFLLLPLAVFQVAGLWPRNLLVQHRNFVLFLVIAVPLSILFSSKPGAGLVHVLPLVPAVMYLVGLILRKMGPELKRVPLNRKGAGLVFAWLLALILVGSIKEYQSIRSVQVNTRESEEVVVDLQEIMVRYDYLKIAMACGGEAANFRKTWLRPLLVFQDNPLFLDPISVMDSCKSGRELSDKTVDAMVEGRVDLWLVPRLHAPFEKKSWYPPHRPIFPEEFIRQFHENFTLAGHSRYFDFWFWDGLEESQRQGKPSVGIEELVSATLEEDFSSEL
ncbi:MAG: hypothetical protein KOO60_05655 [Gemmatimonadales bacterium]|nr:hypothetical protein [Gemmatimonadales bacterium]